MTVPGAQRVSGSTQEYSKRTVDSCCPARSGAMQTQTRRLEVFFHMTLYLRKWNCACCDKQVIYDSVTGELSCGCCTITLKCKPLDLATNWVKFAVPLVKK